MNIVELVIKRLPQVQIDTWDPSSSTWRPADSPEILISKVFVSRVEISNWRFRMRKHTVRGFVLRSGTRVIVRQAAKFWPNFRTGNGCFYAMAKSDANARMIVSWADGNKVKVQSELAIAKKLIKIEVPASDGDSADLVIEVPAHKGGKVFLGVHKLLDRHELYSRCVGSGVEIGPGPKPQILPNHHTQVKYVEQSTPDQWRKLYGKDFKTPVDEALWEHYVVGNADNIPADPGSLDFIFSSHVVEHLANPLGHMAYWNTLLKPGGIIAAIIPDKDGCKDFVFAPSSLDELMDEFRRGGTEVELHHYERWAKHRAPDTPASEILKSGRSIHAHFYTPESMEQILAVTHRQAGFRKFRVISSPNHKDFFVLLTK